jgi:LL-diaminopimelate aminotransferase
VFGGTDAPYLWLQAPRKLSSWEFFDHLLTKGQIISMPGLGFGNEGERYVRLSTFGSAQTIAESVKKFKELC